MREHLSYCREAELQARMIKRVNSAALEKKNYRIYDKTLLHYSIKNHPAEWKIIIGHI